MPEPENEVRYRFVARWSRRSRRTVAGTRRSASAALPRITRLMALAIKLEDLLRDAEIADRPEFDCAAVAAEPSSLFSTKRAFWAIFRGVR